MDDLCQKLLYEKFVKADIINIRISDVSTVYCRKNCKTVPADNVCSFFNITDFMNLHGLEVFVTLKPHHDTYSKAVQFFKYDISQTKDTMILTRAYLHAVLPQNNFCSIQLNINFIDSNKYS